MNKMADFHFQRCEKLRKLLKKSPADAILITNFINVTWLTGFTGGDSYLLVFPDGQILLSDSRYTLQIAEESPGLEFCIRDTQTSMLDLVKQQLSKYFPSREVTDLTLAVEAETMSLGMSLKVREKVTEHLFPLNNALLELRQIKDTHEIALLRTAGKIAGKAFMAMRATLTAEKTEAQLATEMNYTMRLLGARGESFPSIIALDARAAQCHAVPTDASLAGANMLLVDWGADYKGYKSDLTRVLVLGEMTKKFQKIYKTVLDAQQKAIDAIKPGVSCDMIDAVARNYIAKAGFGDCFGHGLGHGIGLQIHEAPSFSPKCHTVLRPGMVITVEPGIYIENWGGVRIEDDILVTRRGCEVLTNVPKSLNDILVD
ncbi:MAG: Xaa-Pro peptidase family protein [Planctomycetia bacterium]|nr:Xaa-Pro peptidase family protein [Planctomycetia bacterium]